MRSEGFEESEEEEEDEIKLFKNLKLRISSLNEEIGEYEENS